tara:strand:+ start:585 stop:1115 length:531 start_codon:yes stop_codon:yes gene_type:complete
VTTPDPLRPGLHTVVVRTLLGLLGVAMVVLWVYAFFIAPSGNPDRLQDRSWPEMAQQRCLEARAVIDMLPRAAAATSPADRADDLDLATDVLADMVADLALLPGGIDDDTRLIGMWLEDWAIYASDRRTHADRLRLEGDVRPLLTALPSGTGSVMKRMNGFARVNDMEACLDPGDV